MNALVGYTGFVGSNIYMASDFDMVYNSKNIEEAYGTNPDLLIYAGLRAEKYLANNAPEKDMESIHQAKRNIMKINPKKLVLISTIDVFKMPKGVDENSAIDTEGLHPYGLHRYRLERWVRENYSTALIIRLPALFGKNIKKNFIYDYIHYIPFMLKAEKFIELLAIDADLRKYYVRQNDGFYRLNISDADRELVKGKFRRLGFSALHFTDSRSVYQFYNLANLWNDMQTALDRRLTIWHPAVEPVSVGEVYEYLTGERFVNELAGVPVEYDYRTIYAGMFGGSGKYIRSKDKVLQEIRSFVEEELKGRF